MITDLLSSVGSSALGFGSTILEFTGLNEFDSGSSLLNTGSTIIKVSQHPVVGWLFDKFF
ncbi:hypothetical protein [Corynebacterium crudilactis]|uniref:hypothetical protein n=1 Tax=Corynebacterium crudilactis TaxID=1652495 RepID=UPI0012FDD406|nr:hypothetical protein [Corynebacterium crudilactis]